MPLINSSQSVGPIEQSTVSHCEFPCDSLDDDKEVHEVDNYYRIKAVQNRTEYPNLIAAAWRFEISNRAVCVLGNDLGIMIFQY